MHRGKVCYLWVPCAGIAVFALSKSVHQSHISRCSRGKATLWCQQSISVGSVSSPPTDSGCVSASVAACGAGYHQETTSANRTTTLGWNWCKECSWVEGRLFCELFDNWVKAMTELPHSVTIADGLGPDFLCWLVLFLFLFHYFSDMVPCSVLSWPPVSLSAHVNILYHIITQQLFLLVPCTAATCHSLSADVFVCIQYNATCCSEHILKHDGI